ncbi:MAG TPA: RHS repeat-associated core domain-containing protein [Thermoanaerobaculia bacterium]|nr:RHS repeat-associated core domain-containing protein [Thermoanaerobaculia bacterium]
MDAGAGTNTDGTTPPGLAPGAPAGAYSLSDFESVSFFSGNLNFTVPLVAVGGRGQASYMMKLPIEQNWRVKLIAVTAPNSQPKYTPIGVWWDEREPDYGPGRLTGRRAVVEDGRAYDTRGCDGVGEGCSTMLREISMRTLTRLTFQSPNGTEFELRDKLTNGQPIAGTWYPERGDEYVTPSRGTVFVSTDGTSATFISDEPISDYRDDGDMPQVISQFGPSGELLLKDGTRYRIDGGAVSSLRDRNGNTITWTGQAAIDPLGRRFDVVPAAGSIPYDQISFKGYAGQSRVIRVWYDSLGDLLRNTQSGDSIITKTYRSLFPQMLGGSDTAHYNPRKVARVELTDGRAYHFRYSEYGDLTRVVLPTGGAIEYDWIYEHTESEIEKRLTTRRVYLDASNRNSLESITRYVTGAAASVRVESPAGTLLAFSRHFFYGSPNTNLGPTGPIEYVSWKNGKEYRSEAFDVVNGAAVLRRRVEHTWQQPAVGTTWRLAQPETSDSAKANDPQITQTIVTLLDTNQVSKQTFAYDQFNNMVDLREFDYGVGVPGPLLRHTHREFLSDIAYTGGTLASPHLRNLVRLVQIFSPGASGAAVLNKQSEQRYDEAAYPLLSPHDDEVTAVSVVGWSDPKTPRRGNVTTVRGLVSSAGTAFELHTQYDKVGNPRRAWDGHQRISRAKYGDRYSDGIARNTFALPTITISRVPTTSATGTAVSGLPQQSSAVYDYFTSLLTRQVDENGETTSHEYNDPLGRLTRTVPPPGGRTTIYRYAVQSGNPSGTYAVEKETQIDATKSEWTKEFTDGLGRIRRTFKHVSGTRGAAGALYATVDIEYDQLGRESRRSRPYNSAGSASAVNPSGRWRETVYDGLGRVIRIVAKPDNATHHVAYSGRSQTSTDPDNKVQRSTYDSLGRLVEVVEDAREGGLKLLTTYDYDGVGNLRSVVQGSQQRFFMYDLLSRLIRSRLPEQAVNTALAGTDPFTGNAQWTSANEYDASNLIARIDPRGVRTDYTFDGLGRVVRTRYSDGTPEVNTTYDGAVNGIGKPWTQEVSTLQNGVRVGLERRTAIAYDTIGRQTSISQQFALNGTWSAPFAVKRTYDLAGNLLSQTYPSGNKITYAYDTAGRLINASGNLGGGIVRTYAGGITYDGYGQKAQEWLGTTARVYHKRFYNVRGQLEAIRVGTTPNDTSWNRGAFLYAYVDNPTWEQRVTSGPRNNGNLRQQMIWIPEDDEDESKFHLMTQSYNYDGLNRLARVSETAGTTSVQDYDYDQWGNRTINAAATTGFSEPQFAVDPATNRVYAPGDLGRAEGQRAMRYDRAGNLVFDGYSGSGARTFDGEQRIVTATTNTGATVLFAYDGEGNRVRRIGGGEERWQVYAGGDLIAEYDAGAQPTSPRVEYGYRTGEIVFTATLPETGGGTHDAVAEFSADTNPSGVWSYGYRTSGGPFTAFVAAATPYGPGAEAWRTASTACCPQIVVNNTGAAYTYPNVPSVVHPPDVLNVHPASLDQRGVIRWTAPAAGTYRITGRFEGIDTVGTTTDGSIHHNGVSLFATNVSGYGARVPFSLVRSVAAGDVIEISVGNGTNNTNSNDSTGVAVTISAFSGDAVADFSAVANSNGPWSYGYRATGSAAFTPYTSASTPYGAGTNAWRAGVACCPQLLYNNTDANYTYPTAPSVVHPPDVLNLHPGAADQRSVIRWTAPTAGTYRISGRFQGLDKAGTSTDVAIHHNGISLFAGHVSGYGVKVPFAISRAVRAGDSIDVSVGDGTNATIENDSTGVALTIIRTDIVTPPPQATLRWLVADYSGTPRLIFDQSGSLEGVSRHDYLPFGEEISTGVNGRTASRGYATFDGVRQQFTGYERDHEISLDYARARYYANAQGRFISVDPLMASGQPRTPQSWNRYAYVTNNPLRWTDPSGLSREDPQDGTAPQPIDQEPGKYSTPIYDEEGNIVGWDCDDRCAQREEHDRFVHDLSILTEFLRAAFERTMPFAEAWFKATVDGDFDGAVESAAWDFALNKTADQLGAFLAGHVARTVARGAKPVLYLGTGQGSRETLMKKAAQFGANTVAELPPGATEREIFAASGAAVKETLRNGGNVIMDLRAVGGKAWQMEAKITRRIARECAECAKQIQFIRE